MRPRLSVAGILFPAARKSLAEMERTLAYLRGKVDMIEFFYEGGDDERVSRLLEENGLASIFVAVIPLKEQVLNLCSLEEGNRRAAVDVVRRCIDRARVFGSHSVMICSGKHPGSEGKVAAALDAFVRSIEEIAAYEARSQGAHVRLLLEPCDSGMDVRHLLGPTPVVVETVRRVRAFCPDFSLTMDVAHIEEEGEDYREALRLAKPYCSHVHFANCVTGDRDDPLYGDKHVDFWHPGAAFSCDSLQRMDGELQELYGGEPFDLALEALCRAPDALEYFDEIMDRMPWFFER